MAKRRIDTAGYLWLILLALHGVTAAGPVPPTGQYPTSTAISPDVWVEAYPDWGVVPFDVVLKAVVGGAPQRVGTARWDFDGDGCIDASGVVVRHRVSEPVNHTIRAFVETSRGTRVCREVCVSGYAALMTLVFDDGHSTVFSRALPILRSRGVTATAYIVPTWLTTPFYMKWHQVDSLKLAGWDIGSHGYTHRHLPELNDSVLHYELRQSKLSLQSRGFAARHLALPYNDGDDRVVAAAREYYESCRGGGGLNPGVAETDPFLLASHCALGSEGFGYYQAHIDSVIASGGWYILNNHKTHHDCESREFCIEVGLLSGVIDYALVNRVRIVNIDEALAYRQEMILRWNPEVNISEVSISPNPFGSEVTVEYAVHGSGQIRVSAYDVRGRLVSTLYDGVTDGDAHSAMWRGTGSHGQELAPGVYFIRLESGTDTVTRRVVLLR